MGTYFGVFLLVVIVVYFARAIYTQKQVGKLAEINIIEEKTKYPHIAELLKQVDSRHDWVCHLDENLLHFFVPSLKQGFVYVKFLGNDLGKFKAKQLGFSEVVPEVSSYIEDEVIDLKYALRKEHKRKKRQKGDKIKLNKKETAKLFGWNVCSFLN